MDIAAAFTFGVLVGIAFSCWYFWDWHP